jgi:hypothetical protein
MFLRHEKFGERSKLDFRGSNLGSRTVTCAWAASTAVAGGFSGPLPEGNSRKHRKLGLPIPGNCDRMSNTRGRFFCLGAAKRVTEEVVRSTLTVFFFEAHTGV